MEWNIEYDMSGYIVVAPHGHFVKKSEALDKLSKKDLIIDKKIELLLLADKCNKALGEEIADKDASIATLKKVIEKLKGMLEEERAKRNSGSFTGPWQDGLEKAKAQIEKELKDGDG